MVVYIVDFVGLSIVGRALDIGGSERCMNCQVRLGDPKIMRSSAGCQVEGTTIIG